MDDWQTIFAMYASEVMSHGIWVGAGVLLFLQCVLFLYLRRLNANRIEQIESLTDIVHGLQGANTRQALVLDEFRTTLAQGLERAESLSAAHPPSAAPLERTDEETPRGEMIHEEAIHEEVAGEVSNEIPNGKGKHFAQAEDLEWLGSMQKELAMLRREIEIGDDPADRPRNAPDGGMQSECAE